MARKTKAELAVEREAAQAARKAHEVAAYPALLMDTLERATELSYELTVEEAKFVVRERSSRTQWSMTLAYDTTNQEMLEALVYDVEREELRRLAEQARYEAKQTALSKLTAEERTLLGL